MQLLPLVRPSGELSKDEIARYSRHLLIPDFGVEGQKCLKNSKVLVIGAGGLGSPVLLYLAAAGVGTLGIIDFDIVEESNLQRQSSHPKDFPWLRKSPLSCQGMAIYGIPAHS